MNAADRERARGLATAARATQRALERFTRQDELPREMYHVLDMPFSVDPFAEDFGQLLVATRPYWQAAADFDDISRLVFKRCIAAAGATAWTSSSSTSACYRA